MNLIKKRGFLFPFFGIAFSLLSVQAQQGWEVNALTSAEYYFASKAFGPAAQYYQIQPYYPSLSGGHDAANFYTLASALRLNTAGAEKMLTAYMVDHPTSCLLYTSPSPRDVEESRMPSSA